MVEAYAFIPGHKYVPISITGQYCDLMCPHCRAKYLRGMLHAKTSIELENLLNNLYTRGVRGFLISGGFTRNGYLKISNEMLSVIKKFKKDHESVFSIHLGMAPENLIESVWNAEFDFVDYEVPPSDYYIMSYRNLRLKVDDYIKGLEKLLTLSKDFAVPHLILDSRGSTLNDELNVVNKVALLKPKLFVALVEIRTPDLNDFGRVKEVLTFARKAFEEVALGCMRSSKFKAYDPFWINNNLINRIATPSREVIETFKLKVVNACCSVPKDKFYLFTQSPTRA